MDKSTLFFHTGNTNYFLGHKNLISLNMTENEYHDAVREGYHGNMTKEGRIIIHEYAHWVQSVGTPYGFYLELINFYENELLRQLEELIAFRLYQGNQIKISPPFKKYIEDKLFYNIQDEKLWELFGQWLDLYFFSILTNKRRDVYYNSVKKYNEFFSAYPECEHTRDIENYLYLPLLFRRVDNFLDRRLSEFIGREAPPKSIKREELYSKKNGKAAIASGLNGISLQITHHSLWESYATVLEYVAAICQALHWHTSDEIFLQLRRCWDSLNVIPAGKMFQHFIVMRMSGEYLPLNRMRFLCEISEGHVNPCFLKLKDKIITNAKLSYDLFMEAKMEFYLTSTMLRMDPLLPEPLEYDYEYYQHQLLQNLVERLWEGNAKNITLTVPRTCDCPEKIKSYLQSWIDNHYIDAQLNFEYI